MGVTATPHPLAGWTPVAVTWRDGRPLIRWCFTEGVQFTDPFFEQTIERCLGDPFRLLFWRESAIEDLLDLAGTGPEPAGLIFHMSRSGSTLVSQMLAALPHVLVISEPGPIEAILRARWQRSVSDEQAVGWVRVMAAALGRDSVAESDRYVIKLGAPAVLHFPLLRRAFPGARCVFVYRDPAAVMVSQRDQTGTDLFPGVLPPTEVGLAADELPLLSAEDYRAAVLAAWCEAALAGARAGDLTLVQYDGLPAAVTEIVAPLFDIPVGARDRATLAAVAARDAKQPAVRFTADSEAKLTRSTPAIDAAVAARLAPVYASLEQVRRESSNGH
jgi:hypothetical protein